MTELMAHHTCITLRALQAAEPRDWQGPWHRMDTIPKSVQALWHLPELLGNLGPHRAFWCWDDSPTIGTGLAKEGQLRRVCGRAS